MHLFSFSLLIILLSCKSLPFHPDQSQNACLSFGNGGGFTGAVTEYFLLDNGKLYREEGGKYEEVAVISQKNTKQMFNLYYSLNINKIFLDDPSNRYFFISYKNGGESHRIVWGGSELILPELKIYYDNLNHLAKN